MSGSSRAFGGFRLDGVEQARGFVGRTPRQTVFGARRRPSLHPPGATTVLVHPDGGRAPAAFAVLDVPAEAVSAAGVGLLVRAVVFGPSTDFEHNGNGSARGRGIPWRWDPADDWCRDPADGVPSVFGPPAPSGAPRQT
ncbi:hypothetical protein ACFXOM_07940 [Streptomyces sp. NPDC059169]|uniref:hypothetical protein n=1 Tax=Streptomyces sp. NPDC059169 TaxID=3346754 RepID=UPI0036C0477C